MIGFTLSAKQTINEEQDRNLTFMVDDGSSLKKVNELNFDKLHLTLIRQACLPPLGEKDD